MLLFGPLRDIAGWREKTVSASVENIAALKAFLGRDDPALGEALNGPGVQVALNKMVVRGDPSFSPGAEVAFLPPMSGG